MSVQPSLTIGLPVHNGMPHLRDAILSLLAQSQPGIEIIISDNASDDGTRAFCLGVADANPQVRYLRNETNLAPTENFRRVLSEARGEYFMWAAHDDKWSERFASVLAGCLKNAPDAVLATPAVIHIREDGTLCSEPPDRPASGASRRANLALLYEDHAASWIYGVWRTTWLRGHFAEYCALP